VVALQEGVSGRYDRIDRRWLRRDAWQRHMQARLQLRLPGGSVSGVSWAECIESRAPTSSSDGCGLKRARYRLIVAATRSPQPTQIDRYHVHMRILALADREVRLDYPALCREENIDLVCLLGDLSYFSVIGLRDVPVAKAGVYGNHCVEGYLEDIGAHDLRFNGVAYGDFKVAGVPGCPRYKAHGEFQYDPLEVEMRLQLLGPCDLLLTHCPPRGVNDHHYDEAHQGWEPLRPWLQQHRPRHLLHGHTYPEDADLITTLYDTEIHYVHGWGVLDLHWD
jgi:hypothetical protein